MASRIVFSTVRFPQEGHFNGGQNTRVYRGLHPITDYYSPKFARLRCEQLAKGLAKEKGGKAFFTIPNLGDEVPQSDEGYSMVSPSCWIVELPE